MADSSKLSKQQKALLVWIAEREGRFKPQKKITIPITWTVVDAVEDTPPRPKPTIVPPEIIKKPVRAKGIVWDVAAFLGHEPTTSKRNTVNRALTALEQRGLVKRGRYKGVKQRTSHVKLTRAGVDAVKEIVESDV